MYNVCKLCRKDKCIPIYVCVLFCLQKKDLDSLNLLLFN